MRKAQQERNTRETQIKCKMNIDGVGTSKIYLEIGFLKHMLETFSKHSLIDLEITAKGDTFVDQHHLIEDLGLVLGKTLLLALGDKKGIYRSGFMVYPMDEALAVISIDIGGRAYLQYDLPLSRRFCGDFDTDLLADFFQAFTNELRANLVIRVPHGRSDHHKIEAVFKGIAKSLRFACAIDDRIRDFIPSTKGVIE